MTFYRTPIYQTSSTHQGVNVIDEGGNKVAVITWRTDGEIPFHPLGHVSPVATVNDRCWVEFVTHHAEHISVSPQRKSLLTIANAAALQRLLDGLPIND